MEQIFLSKYSLSVDKGRFGEKYHLDLWNQRQKCLKFASENSYPIMEVLYSMKNRFYLKDSKSGRRK